MNFPLFVMFVNQMTIKIFNSKFEHNFCYPGQDLAFLKDDNSCFEIIYHKNT